MPERMENPYMEFCKTYRASAEWRRLGHGSKSVPEQGRILGAKYRSSNGAKYRSVNVKGPRTYRSSQKQCNTTHKFLQHQGNRTLLHGTLLNDFDPDVYLVEADEIPMGYSEDLGVALLNLGDRFADDPCFPIFTKDNTNVKVQTSSGACVIPQALSVFYFIPIAGKLEVKEYPNPLTNVFRDDMVQLLPRMHRLTYNVKLNKQIKTLLGSTLVERERNATERVEEHLSRN